MKGERSWIQREYEAALVWMRRGITAEYLLTTGNLSREAILAADYSYQAKRYIVSGWESSARCNRFHAILVRVYASRGEIPF